MKATLTHVNTGWRDRAQTLKREVYVIHLASKDPRVNPLSRWITSMIVAYTFSPIGLIPDIIPIFGYLDDLILIPLGITLALRILPASIVREYRRKVDDRTEMTGVSTWWVGAMVICIWVAAGTAVLYSLFHALTHI